MWQISKWNNETFAWYDDAFTSQQLDTIIEMGKSLSINRAATEGNVTSAIRNNGVNWFSTNGTTKYNFMYETMTAVVDALNRQFFNYDITHLEDLQFTEYKKGEYYKSHKDQGYDKGYARKLSIVMQLSNESDYEGGELHLYDDNVHTPKVMSKKRGRIVVFPSHILHEVKPVTKGTRYSLVCWVHGPRFK